MAIRFDCPNCKANYEVADDLAGKMIMCRVCKKRGAVRSLAAAATATTTATLPAPGASASLPSRRNVLPLVGFVLASVGAVATGALLARQPWQNWGAKEDDFGPGGFRKRRQQDGDDKGKQDGKKDDKSGPV